MLEAAGRFIAACWIVFFVVWFIAAWFTKRTVERSSSWIRWIAAIGLILLVGRQSDWRPFAGHTSLWRPTAALAFVAAAVTAIGLSVALWARATLGGNWSGMIVLKDRHELIDRGPYAFVRHPIYTGVLLMVVGTTAFWGTRDSVVMFAIIVVGLFVKARTEERLLTKHFPEAYPQYRARVRASIIPFLL